jgi:hypothetical protein
MRPTLRPVLLRVPRDLLVVSVLLPASLLVACGDKADDDDDDDTGSGGASCYAQVLLSGAVETQVSVDDTDACAGSGYEDSIGLSWGLEAPYTVMLWVNSGVDITQGSQTGLPATLGIIENDTWAEWTSVSDSCVVDLTDISEDPDWEGSWNFTGEGGCEGPLTNDSDGSEIMISGLSFRGGAPL